ncbi:MAG: hypothetical protein ACTTJC_08450 [Campylobacter sp.]
MNQKMLYRPEIECVSVVDILRRTQIETNLIGLDKSTVVGAHKKNFSRFYAL